MPTVLRVATSSPPPLFGVDHRPPAPDRRRRTSWGHLRQARGCHRTANRRGTPGLLTWTCQPAHVVQVSFCRTEEGGPHEGKGYERVPRRRADHHLRKV